MSYQLRFYTHSFRLTLYVDFEQNGRHYYDDCDDTYTCMEREICLYYFNECSRD